MSKTLTMLYTPLRETKTCYVYQHGEPRTEVHQTLYLKKDRLAEGGISPETPITVTIKEAAEHDHDHI